MDRVRARPRGSRKQRKVELLYTIVSTCRVLDAAKVSLHSDANGVVGVGEHEATGAVIVEAQDLTIDTEKVLETSIGSCGTNLRYNTC